MLSVAAKASRRNLFWSRNARAYLWDVHITDQVRYSNQQSAFLTLRREPRPRRAVVYAVCQRKEHTPRGPNSVLFPLFAVRMGYRAADIFRVCISHAQ